MTGRRTSFSRDLASAYAASLARVGSWVIVSALVFRRSTEAFALLALVRGTLGVLNYAALGVLPAMIRMLARTSAAPQPVPVAGAVSDDAPLPPIDYVTPATARADLGRRLSLTPAPATQAIFAAGSVIATATACLALLVVVPLFVVASSHFFRLPAGFPREHVMGLILGIGGGIVLRWFSEPSAAVLQTHDGIALDNTLVVVSEALWLVMSWAFMQPGVKFEDAPLRAVGCAHAVSGAILALARLTAAGRLTGVALRLRAPWGLVRPLLVTGSLITLAQLADYLYGPTDYILINRLLSPQDLAAYAPAMQIDSGLLLLVTALAAVLLPRAAVDHAAGDLQRVRRDYVRATLASAGLLAAAGVIIYVASPLILRLWLGEDIPATRRILPLVLLNTTLGGSAMVGRSILLATGRHAPFAVSVLLAGVTNVAASYAFVRYGHWGLAGIVAGTTVAVVARCAVWMPWYVLRSLKAGEVRGAFETLPAPPMAE